MKLNVKIVTKKVGIDFRAKRGRNTAHMYDAGSYGDGYVVVMPVQEIFQVWSYRGMSGR